MLVSMHLHVQVIVVTFVAEVVIGLSTDEFLQRVPLLNGSYCCCWFICDCLYIVLFRLCLYLCLQFQ